MIITLDGYAFDPRQTAVIEKRAEQGGREARIIELRGIVQAATSDALDQALDAIAARVAVDALVPLCLRPGRVLQVRRLGFEQERGRTGASAAYTLRLEAPDPAEQSETPTVVEWSAAGPGVSPPFFALGNERAPLRVQLSATGTLQNPVIGDGLRQLEYAGLVEAGQVLLIDSTAARVWLDADDVTPYTTGDFLYAEPGATYLSFTDALGTGGAEFTLRYYDRWN